MIPLAVPNLSGNEARYLQECVDSTFVSTVGPFVETFESMVAESSGGAGAVAVASGTAGLHAALLAVGVGPGDLVIVPSFTFIASANAVAHCGAEPWLFDIDPDSWTLDAGLLECTLETETEVSQGTLIHRANGKRVAAILPVYTMGLPADMARISATARRFGVPIVADAAAALGATYGSRPIAESGADLLVFSFNGNKTVTAGGGGAVTSQNTALLASVRHLTTVARVGENYDHDRVGYNYRMTNLQAAVGCAQMEQLDGFIAAKRRIARRYDQELGTVPGLAPLPAPDWAESACWFSGATVRAPLPPVPEIVSQLRNLGIGARQFWKPAHLQPPFAQAPRTAMNETDRIWPCVLTLPCSTHLSDDEQTFVIRAIQDIARREARST